jgi:hypothetical protein
MKSWLYRNGFKLAIGVVVALLLLTLVFKQTLPNVSGTLYLKRGVSINGNEVKELSGEVVRSADGKYVTVKNGNAPLLEISSDQIDSITLTDSPPRVKLYERLIDSLDLLSKFGIIAGLLAFLFTLKQYSEGQKWKREEFLAAALKDFNTIPEVSNAKQMLDSLQLYGDRRIKLYPEESTEVKRYRNVSNQDIYDALALDKENQVAPSTAGLTTAQIDALHDEIEKKRVIADCFDAFFSYLGRFAYYIDSGLIKKEEIDLHLTYWLNLIGNEEMPLKIPGVRERIISYADKYSFWGLKYLLDVYGF